MKLFKYATHFKACNSVFTSHINVIIICKTVKNFWKVFYIYIVWSLLHV